MSTKTLQNYLNAVKRLVRDKAGKLQDPDDYQSAIERSLIEYSVSRPNLIEGATTSRHIISADADDTTVSDDDFWVVAQLAAAYSSEDLAQHYAQSSENTILQADIAIFRTKRAEYDTRAKQFRAIVKSVLLNTEYSEAPSVPMPSMFSLAKGRRGV